MVFIFNTNFVDGWLVKKSLQTFHGLGPQAASRILAKFFIHPRAKVETLKHPTILALNEELSNMTLETDLKRKVQDNIRRLRDMGTYRGRRHAMGLPVRGQRTKNNITTARKFNRVYNEYGNQ